MIILQHLHTKLDKFGTLYNFDISKLNLICIHNQNMYLIIFYNYINCFVIIFLKICMSI